MSKTWKFEKDCNLFKQYHLSLQLIIKLLLLLFVTLNLNLAIAQTQKVKNKDLEGYEVKFDYVGYPEEREIAYRYWVGKYGLYATTQISKNQIGIDLYDVNSDGESEILTYLQNGGFCGSAGCSFSILVRNKESPTITYKPISFDDCSELTVREWIKVLNNKTDNYHNIGFFKDDDDASIWGWNGKNYYLIKPSRSTRLIR